MGNTPLPAEAKERLASSKKDGGLEVNLSGLHIKRFSSSISSLKHCVSLDLSLNELVELPPSMAKLRNLESLYINNNELIALPPDMLRLRDLKRLNAADNRLTHLPSPIASWLQLELLDLSNNRIEALPLDFARLSSLRSLLYSGNSLRSLPADVLSLPSLTHLDLSDNQLLSLPDSLAGLTSLHTLSLAHNALEAIPDWIGRLTSLTSLNLSANLAPVLPDSLGELSNLTSLDISVLGLTDVMNLRFDRFPKLVSLDLHRNQLPRLPPSIGGLTSLKHLNLSENLLVELPCQIGWLHASLRTLNLEENKLQLLPGEVCFLSVSLDVNVKRNPLKSPFNTLYDRGPAKWSDAMAPFVSAYPAYCSLSGQGVQGAIAGVGTTCVVTAHDMKNQPRVSGGEKFCARVVGPGGVDAACVVKDNGNGTHSVFYNCTKAGAMQLEVAMDGIHGIKGSPFSIYISPAQPSAAFSCCRPFPHGGKPGRLIEFDLLPLDKFGNQADRSSGAIFHVEVTGGSTPQALIADLQNGKYHVSFTPGWADTYTLKVTLSGAPIRGSPFTLTVADDYVAPSAEELEALSAAATATGSSQEFMFAGVDDGKPLYGENKPFGDAYFQKPTDPSTSVAGPAIPFSSSSLPNPALAGLPPMQPAMANPALAGLPGMPLGGAANPALAGLPGMPLGGVPNPALAGLPGMPGIPLGGVPNPALAGLPGVALGGNMPGVALPGVALGGGLPGVALGGNLPGVGLGGPPNAALAGLPPMQGAGMHGMPGMPLGGAPNPALAGLPGMPMGAGPNPALAGLPAGTLPGVSLGGNLPGVSLGTPAVSLGTPGVALGTPGVSLGGPGVSLGGPGVSLGGPLAGLPSTSAGGLPGVPMGGLPPIALPAQPIQVAAPLPAGLGAINVSPTPVTSPPPQPSIPSAVATSLNDLDDLLNSFG